MGSWGRVARVQGSSLEAGVKLEARELQLEGRFRPRRPKFPSPLFISLSFQDGQDSARVTRESGVEPGHCLSTPLSWTLVAGGPMSALVTVSGPTRPQARVVAGSEVSRAPSRPPSWEGAAGAIAWTSQVAAQT